MTKVTEFLGKLDLSELEAKLYITLLESGPQTVRDLAKRAGIGRTTSYPYIDLLLEKGLITKNVKGVHTYVVAAPPQESLKQMVDQKTKQMHEIQTEFPEILNSLNSSINTATVDNPEIRYYKGKTGIIKVYEEALKAKELRSYIRLVEVQHAFPDNVHLFDKAFKVNPDLHVKEIHFDSPIARDEVRQLQKNERYAFKFMPKGVNVTSEDILIFDGKVAILHYKENESSHSIVLNNRDYYNNSKSLFDYMWQTLPQNESYSSK